MFWYVIFYHAIALAHYILLLKIDFIDFPTFWNGLSVSGLAVGQVCLIKLFRLMLFISGDIFTSVFLLSDLMLTFNISGYNNKYIQL